MPTVIDITSNTGSPIIQSLVGQSVEDIEVTVLDELDAKNIESTARIQLKVLLDRLAKMDLTLEVSEAAIA